MIRKINNCEHQTLHSGTLSFTLLLLICNCIPMMNPLLACPHFPTHLGVLVFILGIAAQGGICSSSHIRVLTNLHALFSQEALVLSLQCLEDDFATKASLTKLLNSSLDGGINSWLLWYTFGQKKLSMLYNILLTSQQYALLSTYLIIGGNCNCMLTNPTMYMDIGFVCSA